RREPARLARRKWDRCAPVPALRRWFGRAGGRPNGRSAPGAKQSAPLNEARYREACSERQLTAKLVRAASLQGCNHIYVRPGKLRPDVILPISALEISFACASA